MTTVMTSREESPPPPPPPPPKKAGEKSITQQGYQQQPVHYGQTGYSTVGNSYYQQTAPSAASNTTGATDSNSQYGYQQTAYNPYQGYSNANTTQQTTTPQQATTNTQYSYSNQDWTGGQQNPAQEQKPSYTPAAVDPATQTQSYPQYKDTTGYYSVNQNYSAGYMTGSQYPPGGGGQTSYDSYQNADYNYNGSYGSGYDSYYGYVDSTQDQGGSTAGWDSYAQTNYTGQQDAKTQSANNGSNIQPQQQKLPPQRDPRLEKRGGRGQAAGAGRGRDSYPPQVNSESQPEKLAEGRGRKIFNEMGPSRGGRGGQGSNRGAYSGSYRGDSSEYGRQCEDSSYKRGPPPQMPVVNNNFDGPPDRRGYNDNRGNGYDQMYSHGEEAYRPYQHLEKGWNRNEYWSRGWPDSHQDPRGGDQGRERGGIRGRGDRGRGPRRRGGIDRGGMSSRGRYRDDGGSLQNQLPVHFRGGSGHRGRGRGGPNLMHNDNKVDRNQRSFTYKDESAKDIQSDNKVMSTNRNDTKDMKQAEKHKVEVNSGPQEEQPPVKKPCKVEHKVGVKSSSSPPAIKAEMGTEIFPKVEHNTIVTESVSRVKLEQLEDGAAILPDSTSKDTLTGPSPAKKRRSTDDLPVDPDVEKALEEMMSPLFCKLCNLTINHPSQAQSHYNGKHHAKKVRLYRQSAALEATLAKKAAQGDLVTTVNLVTEVNPATEPADEKPKEEEEEEENKAMSESVIEKMKDKNDRVYCKLCQVAFNSPKQAIQHYEGKNHAKKLKAAGIVQISDKDKQHVKIDGAVFECKMCSVQVTCNEQLQSHLNGAKHKGKLRSLERAADTNRGRWGVRGRGRGRGRGGYPGFSGEEHNVVTIQTQQSRKRGRDYSNFRTPSGSYYCSICNVTVNGENQFAQHMDSRKHKSKYANHKITEEEQQQQGVAS